MTKSELINVATNKYGSPDISDIDMAVRCMLEQMTQVLASGKRIEIQDFDRFSLPYRSPGQAHDLSPYSVPLIS